MQETWVWSLGWKDPLEEEMATHSSILAWKIPWTEEPGGLQSMELQRVGHDLTTEHAHEPLHKGFSGSVVGPLLVGSTHFQDAISLLGLHCHLYNSHFIPSLSTENQTLQPTTYSTSPLGHLTGTSNPPWPNVNLWEVFLNLPFPKVPQNMALLPIWLKEQRPGTSCFFPSWAIATSCGLVCYLLLSICSPAQTNSPLLYSSSPWTVPPHNFSLFPAPSSHLSQSDPTEHGIVGPGWSIY